MVIRRSTPGDAAALRRLAELDSARPLAGEALVAVVDGRLLAATSLDGGDTIADPFERTAQLVELLRIRAGQLRPAPQRRRLRAGVRIARSRTA